MLRPSSRVTPDNKGRICIFSVLSKEERQNYGSFRMYRDHGKIILEPVVDVPEKDHWIYKHPKALASLLRGIKDFEEGRISPLTNQELDEWEKELENE
jgi:hypothetical protein